MDVKIINGKSHSLVTCSFCSKSIWRRTVVLKKYKQSFCNQDCLTSYKGKSIEKECAFCNKTVNRRPSEIKKSKSGRVFCNRSCATSYNNKFKIGKKHGNWNGGYSSYRMRALREYGSTCSNVRCELKHNGIKIPEVMLDVDHIDSDRSNNKIENLQILCVWCHAKKTRNV